MKKLNLFLFAVAAFCACSAPGTEKSPQDAIISGVAWFDQNNNEVNAHGTCIVKEDGLYYMFGEYKTDTSNAFIGFGCYSSADLINWKFENMALPRQADGLLGPDRVGERPKVMKCPATGEFVMYMHCDNLGYKDQYIGYATCNTINGDYEFQGPILMDGKPIRKWDMGSFRDTDGKGYLLTHSGFIYALSDDYKSVDKIVIQDAARGESPAMFKHNGTYYWMFSHLTSWERNDNTYYTAPALEGPWTMQGYFAPEGTLTWNSQTSFVLPVYNETDTMFMFMGDRWSFPMQGSAATYVWQPITLEDGKMSIPEFHQAWKIDLENASWSSAELEFDKLPESEIKTSGKWSSRTTEVKIDGKSRKESSILSKEMGATLSCTFKGRQIAVYGISNNMSGYAKLTISDNNDNEVLSTILDMYSKYELPGLKFISPVFDEGEYTLAIEVAGIHPVWTDKSKTIFGSKDDNVTITGIYVL